MGLDLRSGRAFSVSAVGVSRRVFAVANFRSARVFRGVTRTYGAFCRGRDTAAFPCPAAVSESSPKRHLNTLSSTEFHVKGESVWDHAVFELARTGWGFR